MKKRNVFLIAFGACLCAVTLLGAVGFGIYRLASPAKETGAPATEQDIAAQDEPPEEVVKTYTQEELETLLAEACARQDEQSRQAVLNSIKETLLGGTTTVETLRPYYPDEIVLVSGGEYHFIPIIESLRKNEYKTEQLSFDENGFASYTQDGEVISHKGIDVSKFQGKIDWNKVAADGVEFAFIRVGYRGYGAGGTLNEDATFDYNMAGANRAGVHAGVYFYSQAITEEELLEEVALVLKKIAPYKVTCPVVFDVEKVNGNGRMNEITVEERTRFTKLFCEKIKEAGYTPMIYQNMEMGSMLLDMTQLEEYAKWFAYYNDYFYYPYAYDVWQYSESGRVDGISEKVDLNISFKPLWEE